MFAGSVKEVAHESFNFIGVDIGSALANLLGAFLRSQNFFAVPSRRLPTSVIIVPLFTTFS